jgi:hypothetical protein
MNPDYNISPMQYCYNPCATQFKLAHAYVPFQNPMYMYPPMKGLEKGTIYPDLDRPYGADPEYTVDA